MKSNFLIRVISTRILVFRFGIQIFLEKSYAKAPVPGESRLPVRSGYFRNKNRKKKLT